MSFLKDFAPHPIPLPVGERGRVRGKILIEFGKVIVRFVSLNELSL
jgi:hypothetical protein